MYKKVLINKWLRVYKSESVVWRELLDPPLRQVELILLRDNKSNVDKRFEAVVLNLVLLEADLLRHEGKRDAPQFTDKSVLEELIALR